MNPTPTTATPSKWVSFDCYGTLVDWNSGFADILNPVAGHHTSALLKAYHHFEPLVQAERPFRSYREVLITSLLLAARQIGISLSEDQAALLPEKWGLLPVFSDVHQALATLRARRLKLAVLTNCDEDLFAQTSRSFQHPFDLVITAQRVQAYKPALTHFQGFQRAAGVDLAAWVHVACSLFHDIEPAHKMGIRSIWLNREAIGQKPSSSDCLRITSATELPDAIQRFVDPSV
jgi:2-haloacid dehalogenase